MIHLIYVSSIQSKNLVYDYSAKTYQDIRNEMVKCNPYVVKYSSKIAPHVMPAKDSTFKSVQDQDPWYRPMKCYHNFKDYIRQIAK